MSKEQNCHRTKNTTNSKSSSLHTESAYDDGNIPEIDLNGSAQSQAQAQPLPESSRPRTDGPGGN